MCKVHKLLSSIICCSMLLLLTGTAFATASPHYLVTQCPKCTTGVVYHKETEKFDEKIQRQHDSHFDTVYEYTVTIHEYCDSCPYTYDDSFEREYIVYCLYKK